MKKITFWLFALFTCWQISAQTTVTIGTGTAASGTTDNGNPIYRSSATSAFNFGQSVQLLTAADLAAAGVTAGSTISKIAYYKTNAFTMAAGRTAALNIYLKNSSATALTTTSNFATWTTGSTNCYANPTVGAADIPAVAGWVEFTFTTPFNYSGGSIEVALDWVGTAPSSGLSTGSFLWQYTASTAIQAVGTSASAAIGTANLASSQLRQYNTQITYSSTPCSGTPTPGNTIAPATTCEGSSVTLSLQNATTGSGVTYQWYMNAAPISGANSSTYTIPSLTTSDNYYCEVTCGGNTGTSNPLLVTPSVISTLPWTEGFEGLAIGNNIFPSCWGYENTLSVWNIETTPVANTGANSLGRTWSTDGWAYTPTFTLTAGTSYRFSYYMRTQDTTVGYDVTTAVGTGKTSAAMTTTLGTPLVGYQGPSWNKFNFEFTPSASGNYTFGVRVVAPVAPNGINFDDFVVELSPTCPDQTGLVVSGITSSGANTSWDDMTAGGALGYEYAITTSATPPASGTATASTFFIATGLSPQTVYYLHVRSTCAASTFGNWATTTFTTACVAVTTLPWTEGFETVATGTNVFPTCWDYENTAGDWNIETFPVANSGANSLGRTWSTNGWAFTPTFTLTAGTSYRFSYYMRTQDTTVGYDVTTAVGAGQSAIDMTTTLGTPLVGYQGPSWNKFNFEFTPTTTGDYTFGVRVVAPAAPNGINFDDFRVELSPTCPDQTGLVVANITTTGADTSWDDMTAGGAVGYEYAITTSATPPASGTATTNTFFIATGLTQSTVYYLHVRVNCGASNYGSWITTSFTTLTPPPANDDCATAITLTPGPLHTSNPVATSNVGATNSNPPAPGCASFSGGDVWFTVAVPASGNISLETITGTVTDTGLAVYSGTCAGLTLIDCDDDSALNAGSNSYISLTGRTPGEVLYVNAWDFGNNNFGTFSVTAYDASLSAASFDTSSFVAYPNPVKDVLNLSYKTAISNVKVINLLGQEVLNTKANTNDVQVNMSALTAGAYIVNITVEDTVHTIKVIKE